MLIVFIICIFTLFYVYLGYPLAVVVCSMFMEKKIEKYIHEPVITILIAAYNEEVHIGATIQNKLELDYPKDKLEIIVISDGSTDGTDEIAQRFENQGVRLIRQEPRKGKTAALNLAVPHAGGEIIAFSDANSIYASDALKKMARNFKNPDVGYVTGKMIYINSNGSSLGDGCSAYMKYENLLRAYETKIGSTVGVNGGVDIVRKELYKTMRDDQLPDLILPLMVIEQGYRVIYEPDAIVMESSLDKTHDEYKMRVRVTLRALWALYDMRKLLNIVQFKLFAWQVLTHKFLRYLGFIFLIGLYVSNVFLVSKAAFWGFIYVLQHLFYALVLLVHTRTKKQKSVGLLYIPYYFVLLNIAAAHAFMKFLRGQRQVTWTPRAG